MSSLIMLLFLFGLGRRMVSPRKLSRLSKYSILAASLYKEPLP